MKEKFTEPDYRPTEERIFWHMLSQISLKGWKAGHEEARELVYLGIGLGLIDAERGPKLIQKLECGEVMLREDGLWACTTCGGNCGQCGDTDFYGNIGVNTDILYRTIVGEGSLPAYAVKPPPEPPLYAFMKTLRRIVQRTIGI